MTNSFGQTNTFGRWALLFSLLLASMAGGLEAQITSAGTGAWNSTDTWSTGTVPTSSDDVTILATHEVVLANGATANFATLTIDANGKLLTNTFNSNATLAGTGGITNAGTLEIRNSVNLESNVSNTGTVTWSNSTFSLATPTSISGVTITNQVGGNLNIFGRTGTSNVGIINFGTASINGDGNTAANFPDEVQNMAGANWNMSGRCQLTTVVNTGAIQSSGNASVNGLLTQNGTVTTTGTGGFSVLGSLTGSGTFTGSNINGNLGSTISSGTSPSCLSFTNGAGFQGNLNIEIGGTTACTDYDQIQSGGTIGFSNTSTTLNVSLINGYAPTNDISFVIIDAGSLGTQEINSGRVTLPDANWSIAYNTPNTGEVSVVYTVPCAQAPMSTSVASGNWDNPATWSDGVVPDECNDVIIAANHDVTLGNGATANFKTLTINANGKLFANTFNVDITLAGTGGITNAGTLELRNSVNIESDVSNTGTLDWYSTVFDLATPTSTSGVTITNQAGGNLNITGRTSTSSIDIVNFGTATIAGDGNTAANFPDDVQNMAGANWNMSGRVGLQGTFTNMGAMQSSGNSSILGILTQNGTLSTTGGGGFSILGTLEGTGSFVGDNISSNVNGIIKPGNAGVGCMSFANGLTTSGTLEVEIGGTTPCTDFDQLDVNNTVNVNNATLNVTLINSYTLDPNLIYTIVDADAITGTFNTSGLTLPGTFQVRYNFPTTGKVSIATPDACAITASAVTTAENCPGSGDGTITVTANCISCTGNLEYSLDGATPQSSNVFTGLADDTYTITVSQVGGGCTTDIPATVAAGTGGGTITSAGNGAWGLTTTWVGDIVPTECNDVVIAANHAVNLTGATATFNTLTINALGSLTVTGVSTLNGSTITNEGALTVGANIGGSGIACTADITNAVGGTILYEGAPLTTNNGITVTNAGTLAFNGVVNELIEWNFVNNATVTADGGIPGGALISGDFTNNGSITVGSFKTLAMGGNFTNNGSVGGVGGFGLEDANCTFLAGSTLGDQASGGSLSIHGNVTVTGAAGFNPNFENNRQFADANVTAVNTTMSVPSGATYLVNGNSAITGATSVTVAGTFNATGDLATDAPFVNQGNFNWTAGNLTEANSATVTLTNQTGGTMNLGALQGQNIAWDIVNDGTIVSQNIPGTTVIASDFTNNAGGVVTLQNQRGIEFQGTTDNEGTFNSLAGEQGGVFNTGTFRQCGTMDNVSFRNDGTLSGNGTFSSPIIMFNGGVLAPGCSPGCLVFEDGFTMATNDTGLEIEVQGPTACTDFDQLQVTGRAKLFGNLDVSFLNGYNPTAPATITFIDADEVRGGFSTITPALPTDWSVQYNYPSVGQVSLVKSSEACGTITISDVTATEVSCPEASDATATVTASCVSCTGALEYSFNAGETFQSGASFTGLDSGAVNIIVQEANTVTCNVSEVIDIQVGTAPVIPVANCQSSFAANLASDGNGGFSASVTAEDIDLNSFDPCGNTVSVAITAGTTSFDCDDLSNTFTVTMMVTNDETSLTNTCQTTVTVTDNQFLCNAAPVAACTAVTVDADANCQGAVAGAMVGVNSSDPDDDPLTFMLAPAGPYSLGDTPVTLTVSDGQASSTCTTTITVEDNTPPTMLPLSPVTIDCGASVSAPLTFDNCAGPITGTTNDPVTFSGTGSYTITWNFNDGNGNDIDVDQMVNVVDQTAPTFTCPSTETVTLNVCGDITLTAADLGLSGTDNCGGAVSFAFAPASLSGAGTTGVSVTASDETGNTTTTNCTVMVTTVENPAAFTITADTEDLGTSCPGAPVTFTAATLLDGDVASNGATLEIQEVTSSQGTITDDGNGNYTFTPNAGVTGNVSLNYVVKTEGDDLFSSDNGHFYEFVSAPDISWTDAKIAAEGMILNGQQGYLVTITSQAEQDFVETKLEGQGWMGATDIETPNVWKWVTGPEAGTVFFNQTVGGSGGTSVNGAYSNWLAGEPNNFTGSGNFANGESYGHFRSTGKWNDFPVSTAGSPAPDGILGYVVEYGAANCVPDQTATASITLNIEDTTPPEITCPENITAVATSAAGAMVSFTAAEGTDNCSGATTAGASAPTTGLASGSTFPIGVTTMTYTVTDGSNNMADCSFTITVSGVAPDVVCPENITVSNDAGDCSAIVSFAATETAGIPASTITYSQDPGTSFPVGTTTVMATATNAVGSDACSFTVTVNDTELPVITCPDPITVNNDEGDCSAVVTVPAPTATDNCSAAASMPVGSQADPFTSLGQAQDVTTDGTYHFDVDGLVFSTQVENGWVLIASTTGTPGLSSGALVANSNLSLQGNSILPAAAYADASINRVRINATSGSFLPFDVESDNSGVLANLMANKPLQVGLGGGANEWTGDGDQYMIHSCDGITTTLNEAIFHGCGNQSAVQWLPISGISQVVNFSSGDDLNLWVKATATAAPASIMYANDFNSGSDGSGTYPVGTTVVEWTATDATGNTSLACTQSITVLDDVDPEITCPEAIDVIATSAAGAEVTFADATATDNCSATVSQTAGLASGVTFPIGVTTVTFTAADPSSNAASCSFDVTVTGVAPDVSCPDNITVSNDEGDCGAVVSFEATETTGIPASTITYSQDPGTSFPVGTTTVMATATNAVGSDACSFTVTVNDTELPVITCPDPITVNNDEGDCSAIVMVPSPTATDNCSAAASMPVGSQADPFTSLGQAQDVTTDGTYHFDVDGLVFSTQVENGWVLIASTTGTPGLSSGALVANSNLSLQGNSILPAAAYADASINRVRINATSGSFLPFDVESDNSGVLANLMANKPLQVGLGGGTNEWTGDGDQYMIHSCDGITTTLNEAIFHGCGNQSAVQWLPISGISQVVNFSSGDDLNLWVKATATAAPASIMYANDFNSGSDGSGTYPVGTTVVEWTATDATGNTSLACTQSITVLDDEDPVITCPAAISVVATSAAGAEVTFADATATDNCSATVSQTAGLASGVTFPIGVTTVTFTAADPSSNAASCSFDVTVTGVAPDVSCPDNITVSNDEGDCGAVVSFEATETTGIPASTITYSQDAGTSFPVGTTTVMATATNAVGSDACSFTVTVNDTELPVITCPDPITVNNDEGDCSAVVTVPAPTATDNCSAAASMPVGSQADPFTSLGQAQDVTTDGTYHFDVDGLVFSTQVENGWVLIASTTGTPGLSSGALVANSNLSLQGNSILPAAAYADASINRVRINATSGSFLPFDVESDNSGVLANLMANKPLQVGLGGGANEWTGDGDQYMIHSCDGITTSLNEAIFHGCGNQSAVQWLPVSGISQVVNFSPGDDLNLWVKATATTAPASFLYANDFNSGADGSGTYPVGTTVVEWTATDAAGNTSLACTQSITVLDAEMPEISCPAAIDVIATSAAGAVVTFADATATDNCSATVSQTAGLASGATFPIGVTTVTFEAEDLSENAVSCSFDVTVTGVAPDVSCPENITVSNDAGDCSALVSFAATETAGIPASTITYSQDPGTSFPVGTTMVTATATNAVGSDDCTFTVTVNDAEMPVVTCEESISVSLSETGTATVSIADVLLNSSDNCSVATTLINGGTSVDFDCDDISTTGNVGNLLAYTSSGSNAFYNSWDYVQTFIAAESGDLERIENLTVWTRIIGQTFTATVQIVEGNDPLGTNVLASETITVTSTPTTFTVNFQNPTTLTAGAPYYLAVRLPSNLVGAVSEGGSGAFMAHNGGQYPDGQIFIPLPGNSVIPFDNDLTFDAVVSGSSSSGNVVTLAVTDATGNTTECTTVVTVIDDEDPVITCPAAISTVATSASGAEVTFADATATDNCSATVSQTAGLASGATFPIGVSTVTFTATDPGSNAVSCSFDVTVTGVAPDISCPENITVNNDAGDCGAIVSFAATETAGIPASTITYSQDPGTSFSVGTVTVTATATNAVGSDNCTFTVTVNDAEMPVAACQDITVSLDANGMVAVSGQDIDFGSTDNCSVQTLSLVESSVSAVIENLNVEDYNESLGHGQSFIATTDGMIQSIEVGIVAPSSGHTVYVYASGTGSGAPGSVGTPIYVENNVDLAASPANGLTMITLSTPVPVTNGQQYSFVISGYTNVRYSLEDEYPDGDFIFNYDLGSGCCEFGDLAFRVNIGGGGTPVTGFDCDDLGEHEVTLVVADAAGNESSCNATITVEDDTAADFVCPDPLSLELDVCGGITLTNELLGLNGTDNCGGELIFTISPATISGATTTEVTITAMDALGNTSATNCTVSVTTTDNPAAFTVTAGTDDLGEYCINEPVTFSAATLLGNDEASNGATLEIQDLGLFSAADGTLVDNMDGTWTLTPATNQTGTVSLTYTVTTEGGDLYFEDNGHFYQYVAASGISWSNARDAAAAMTLNGQQGYLATITSAAENDFITQRVGGYGWIGASDAATEGDWRWVTGPEAGQPFWQGLGSDVNSGPVNGAFANWTNQEPNNLGNEDYAHTATNGFWNDWPNSIPRYIDGYVVEFGAGDCTPNQVGSGTIIVAFDDMEVPVITCPDDIVIISTEEVAAVTFDDPVAMDNCSSVFTVQTEGNFSGGLFPLGTTTNTFVATDLNGLSATCSFTVTVTNEVCDVVQVGSGYNYISFDVQPDAAVAFASDLMSGDNAGKLFFIAKRDASNGQIQYYVPQFPQYSTDFELIPGAAYYVFAFTPTSIELCGTPIDPTFRPAVASGYNWLGYIPQDDALPADFFGGINGLFFAEERRGSITSGQVRYYVPTYPQFNNLTEVANGVGYSVFSFATTDEGNWLTESSDLDLASKSFDNLSSNAYTAVMGDVHDVPEGTSIDVVDADGRIYGTLTVGGKGRVIVTAVFGYDQLTEAIPELTSGTELFFSLNGELAQQSIIYTGEGNVEWIDLEFSSQTDTEELVLNAEAVIYPNPFVDEITLELTLDVPATATIKLMDVRGRLVLAQEANVTAAGSKTTLTVPAEQLPAGLYLLRIETSEGLLLTRKVQKVKR